MRKIEITKIFNKFVMEAGGEPSTWLPPEGLVEHYLAQKLNDYHENRDRIYSKLF